MQAVVEDVAPRVANLIYTDVHGHGIRNTRLGVDALWHFESGRRGANVDFGRLESLTGRKNGRTRRRYRDGRTRRWSRGGTRRWSQRAGRHTPMEIRKALVDRLIRRLGRSWSRSDHLLST